jgi:hypothetical protein
LTGSSPALPGEDEESALAALVEMAATSPAAEQVLADTARTSASASQT